MGLVEAASDDVIDDDNVVAADDCEASLMVVVVSTPCDMVGDDPQVHLSKNTSGKTQNSQNITLKFQDLGKYLVAKKRNMQILDSNTFSQFLGTVASLLGMG